MNSKIDITKLNPEHHQALTCMFYARLPKEDVRYKKRNETFLLFQRKFNKKANTYKNAKDTYDAYFDSNNRVGWHGRNISSRGREYQEVYDWFKDYDINILEEAVKDIIKLYQEPINNYMALRLTDPDTVHGLLAGSKDFVVDRITDLSDKLNEGRIIFVAIGGDKGKSTVDWDTGFYAIAHVSKSPYDVGYEKNQRGSDYFKFDMSVDIVLDYPIPRGGFIDYPDTYDAAYIGLEIHRDRSQANSMLEDEKAIAIVRATLDKMPHLKDQFDNIFPKEFMERVYGAATVLIPTAINYGENIKSAVNEQLQLDNDINEVINGATTTSKDVVQLDSIGG